MKRNTHNDNSLAGCLKVYLNKEAGLLDQFIRPNKYVRDLQDKYPKSLIPVKPRGTDFSSTVAHISSDITADLGDKLRGKKFNLGDKTSLTELISPDFIKRLPVRTSLPDKVDEAVIKVLKDAPAVVAPPETVSMEKAATIGYYAGYMMSKEAEWYDDALKNIKDWWGKRSDTEKDLITAGGGALAGGAIGAGFGGWKGALGGALGGAGLAYGGRKAYNWWQDPERKAQSAIADQVKKGPRWAGNTRSTQPFNNPTPQVQVPTNLKPGEMPPINQFHTPTGMENNSLMFGQQQYNV